MSGHSAVFARLLADAPLIAILRGLPGEDAIAVGEALHAAGVRLAEVPLNSPAPFDTIAALSTHFAGRMLIGAGTVLQVEEVERLATTGCGFVVSPNTDAAVIAATLAHGMVPVPGFASPSEAFAALAAGARHLKAFPAHGAGERLAALRAVLPAGTALIAVGGVAPQDLAALRQAGVDAVGIGSDLYRPARAATEVGARARHWMQALRRCDAPQAQLLCDPQAMVGESPLLLDGQLLWLDPTAPALLRWDGTVCTRLALSEPVWALGLAHGRLVGNGEPYFVTLDADGKVHAGPAASLAPGCRFNDMAVDARGGLWAGSMHRGLLSGRGALFHAPHIGHPPRQVADGLGVANGMAFSADGATLYVVDTLARTLLAYPVDSVAGTLGQPRVVSDFLGVPGKPDGLARAPDGHLWVAMWGGDAVVELAPNGALLRSVAVPAHHVGSLCFGDDGTLYVTTARARLSASALERQPGAGGLFACLPRSGVE